MTRRTSVSDFTVPIRAMVDRLDTGKRGDTSAAASALKLDQLQFLSDIFKMFFSRAFYADMKHPFRSR
jgi:zona occludens toxin (predicted ATPase)